MMHLSYIMKICRIILFFYIRFNTKVGKFEHRFDLNVNGIILQISKYKQRYKGLITTRNQKGKVIEKKKVGRFSRLNSNFKMYRKNLVKKDIKSSHDLKYSIVVCNLSIVVCNLSIVVCILSIVVCNLSTILWNTFLRHIRDIYFSEMIFNYLRWETE